jgi:hypothetical protein
MPLCHASLAAFGMAEHQRIVIDVGRVQSIGEFRQIDVVIDDVEIVSTPIFKKEMLTVNKLVNNH